MKRNFTSPQDGYKMTRLQINQQSPNTVHTSITKCCGGENRNSGNSEMTQVGSFESFSRNGGRAAHAPRIVSQRQRQG